MVRSIALVLAEAAVLIPVREQTPEPALYDADVTVRLLNAGTETDIPLHDYLIGVVFQEMPASFEPETLKAQAVTVRIFTVHCITVGDAHETVYVCGVPACCQCYLDAAEGHEIYGDWYEAAEEKVREAVETADGQVMTCEGTLIEAVYFSSTYGSTESAAVVWGGNEGSYLQAVSSPEDARVTEQRLPLEDFQAAQDTASG